MPPATPSLLGRQPGRRGGGEVAGRLSPGAACDGNCVNPGRADRRRRHWLRRGCCWGCRGGLGVVETPVAAAATAAASSWSKNIPWAHSCQVRRAAHRDRCPSALPPSREGRGPAWTSGPAARGPWDPVSALARAGRGGCASQLCRWRWWLSRRLIKSNCPSIRQGRGSPR